MEREGNGGRRKERKTQVLVTRRIEKKIVGADRMGSASSDEGSTNRAERCPRR